MRTDIEIDDDLMRAALEATGAATKEEAVRLGLEALVRLHRQRTVRELRGGVAREGDLEGSRVDAP
ncbi:type II toxin-antitoxin system VapB family antitoxin [Quadrisphaera sp. DSM 44207]|uniref:type II toxin-antitoxin system VapB family antitoxin n=1 Tax=Quadrisphaera sp. DSM 44207 TaxID=1881057 RepID=UPI00089255E4|nr:type II toxin-antitoxin system VapB family antitoxin [Quadrisphaera sp. DSM 44207]SDQ10389.1 antitoxin of type II TA system, VapB [Quadrisphaera sp. DSM 44207]